MGVFGNLFGTKVDVQALKAQGAVIIDVRTPGEFAGGHANGAINMPLQTINSKLEDIRKKDKPVLLCCASGMRSGRATGILKKAGIEAYNAGPWTNVK